MLSTEEKVPVTSVDALEQDWLLSASSGTFLSGREW